ncbi:hypothetical protein TURU_161734 [Turdus rufiventris]|nr:hypothetical protein TURU_161734 [Turdus rufiventris]
MSYYKSCRGFPLWRLLSCALTCQDHHEAASTDQVSDQWLVPSQPRSFSGGAEQKSHSAFFDLSLIRLSSLRNLWRIDAQLASVATWVISSVLAEGPLLHFPTSSQELQYCHMASPGSRDFLDGSEEEDVIIPF